MKRRFLLALLPVVAVVAQTPRIIEDKQIHIITGQAGAGPGAGAFTFVSAEASFEASVVKGAPFSGEFVTENSQVLGDGNRIKSTNTTAYARDGEGRTRREITISAIGPFTGDSNRKTIFIHDPVAKVDYVLDPQAKTARKMNIAGMMNAMPTAPASGGKEGPAVVFNHRIEGPKEVVIEDGGPQSVSVARMPLPPGMVMQGQAGAVISQRITIPDSMHTASGNANFKNEPLGKRMIDGVEAEGTRTTVTIPAGQIGNERALDTVSERWYSNELKTVVLTTRKDPRTGESTYKLANLRRGEPSRQLFELPPDYTIVTEENVGPTIFRMRSDKKQE